MSRKDPRAFVIMTAMPPTKGHLHLIEFAEQLTNGVSPTVVLVCTQPSEPMPESRYLAVKWAAAKINSNISVQHLDKEIEQNPQAEGFWDMWVSIMKSRGFRKGDYFVSSESYGIKMAELLEGHFMPYDPNRELYYTKATNVRNDPSRYFADILPEFQHYLRMNITIFGAESTGKTTLSLGLSERMNGHWLFEYARPYLEMLGNGDVEHDITVNTMTDIWKGQLAIQRHVSKWRDKPFVFLDTDLYSTVGYWQFEQWESLIGEVPPGLVKDAQATKSDLYIITKSNIPFEEDPLRYGGTEREGSDEYWIRVCEEHNLNYVVLNSTSLEGRIKESEDIIMQYWQTKANKLCFEREFNQ